VPFAFGFSSEATITARYFPSGSVCGALCSGVGVGVALVYHVVESSKDVEGVKVDDQAEIDSVVTVGFGLQFPANTLSTAVVFGVKDPTRHDAVIVEADLPDESE